MMFQHVITLVNSDHPPIFGMRLKPVQDSPKRSRDTTWQFNIDIAVENGHL
jgi:hypothetical protein